MSLNNLNNKTPHLHLDQIHNTTMAAQKFTLSFSKTIEKKCLQPSAIRNEVPAEVKNTTEVLQSIEENVLKTDGPTEEEELVIPLVKADRAAVFQKLVEKLKESKRKEEDEEGSKNPATEEETNKEQPRILTLDEQAEAALLEESKRRLDTYSDRGTNDNFSISLTAKEEKLETKVVDLGKESSLDDYDQVDVSVYGAALLRGMGWKKSEGIGRGNKKVVEIINPSSKTFGLAGKRPENEAVASKGGAQEEELTLAKGSCVLIHSGRHRGTYGTVESLDEDHLLVKAAVSQNVIREVELNVKVVSQKEFKDMSRVINKDMYDKFKEEEARKKDKLQKTVKEGDANSGDEENKKTLKGEQKLEKTCKQEEILSGREGKKVRKHNESSKVELKLINTELTRETEDIEKASRHSNDSKCGGEYERNKAKKDHNLYSKTLPRKVESDVLDDKHQFENSKKIVGKYFKYDKYEGTKNELPKHIDHSQSSYSNSKSKAKKREYEDNDQESNKVHKVHNRMPVIPWVRENLRVRLISKSYKGGRYHKQKVIVQSVETAECCECVTEEGKVLKQVHPAWLETVIPKVHPQIVMIVRGQQKGQKGRILQLHREQEKASVQFLEDPTVIVKFHYDDVCEYVQR